ncbi:glycosyltransferase family 2 protein [Maricaulis parjimensis]|uniref:glycosyltransferase family 2 protein n=1 Tax=Maricaulis parjimensis TaxID=144023 RepID=UPI0019394BDD|nr:glycosyltransferase family 2 protein [Maricaulis parjimensis]
MSDAARLSVVTVAWQTGPRLLEAVASILAAPGVDEFVLVNHGNPPELIRALRTMASNTDKFVLIETGANMGFAKGCNIGARRTSGDYVLFLNPDAVLAPGVASRLKASAADLKNEALWAIGARITNADGTEQRGGRRGELTPASALATFFGLNRFLPGARNLHFETQPLSEDMVPMPVVSGAALMMRRDDFLSIGGFDERYFLHVEDIDLCRNIRERGGSVWFEPRANIKHYGGTSQSSPFFVESHKGLGFVKYFWKYYPGPLQRLATMALIGPIFTALWGRAGLLRIKGLLEGAQHRRAVVRRLRRLKAHRAARS